MLHSKEDLLEAYQKTLYTISHDLSASFRHIRRFSDILNTKIEAKLSSQNKEIFNHLQKAVQKSENMLAAILELSHIKTQEQPNTCISLTDIINSASESINTEIKSCGATINIDNAIPNISVEKDSFTKIFIYILQNSIKFSRENTPPIIDIKAYQIDNHYQITIKDNGRGIQSDTPEMLFHLFKKEIIEQKDHQNLGAGLAIVQKIIEHHKGTITFSDCKTGCLVKILMPIDTEITIPKKK